MQYRKLPTKLKVFLTFVFIIFMFFMLYFAQKYLDTYLVRILTLIGIYGIMAVSLTFINGITGIFSLGHSGFIAIGAYTAALLTMSVEQKQMSFFLKPLIWPLNSIQLDFLSATIIAGVMAAIFAYLIGYPSLRLTGDYLAITTLGFGEIVRILILNMISVTNGPLGLKGLEEYTNIWWAWGWLFVTVLVIASLVNSSYGRALKAIREDPVAAKAMGIDVTRHQLLAFIVGAFFAGISGSLYAHWLTTIDPRPQTVGVLLTFNILIMIVLGGLGSITGAIFGAGIFAILSEWLRVVEEPFKIFGIQVPAISGMRLLVLSTIFVTVMLTWRRGIMGRNELTWDNIYNFFLKFKRKY